MSEAADSFGWKPKAADGKIGIRCHGGVHGRHVLAAMTNR
jgi:hypothetical protein